MKRLALVTAAAALLFSSAAAFAAPKPDKHGRDDDRRDDRREESRHDNGRHLGHQKQAWRRGDHLPAAYRGQAYYIEDYRAYRLAPPPRGYRWVRPYRDENQYILIQISTGLIDRIFGY
jgi:Ni/Co efflux regulator RcnB